SRGYVWASSGRRRGGGGPVTIARQAWRRRSAGDAARGGRGARSAADLRSRTRRRGGDPRSCRAAARRPEAAARPGSDARPLLLEAFDAYASLFFRRDGASRRHGDIADTGRAAALARGVAAG